MNWQLAIILWIVCGIGAYVVAQGRGSTSPGAWFVAGVLFGPFGLAAAFFARPGAKPVPVSRWTAPSALIREYHADNEPQARYALANETPNAERAGYVVAGAEWMPGAGDAGVLRVTLAKKAGG